MMRLSSGHNNNKLKPDTFINNKTRELTLRDASQHLLHIQNTKPFFLEVFSIKGTRKEAQT